MARDYFNRIEVSELAQKRAKIDSEFAALLEKEIQVMKNDLARAADYKCKCQFCANSTS